MRLTSRLLLGMTLVLTACSTTPLSREDMFINATAQIACATQHMAATDTADNSQPNNAQPTGKDIQAKADELAKQFGFKGVDELNELAKSYKANQNIVNKTKEKIKQMCP